MDASFNVAKGKGPCVQLSVMLLLELLCLQLTSARALYYCMRCLLAEISMQQFKYSLLHEAAEEQPHLLAYRVLVLPKKSFKLESVHVWEWVFVCRLCECCGFAVGFGGFVCLVWVLFNTKLCYIILWFGYRGIHHTDVGQLLLQLGISAGCPEHFINEDLSPGVVFRWNWLYPAPLQ